MPIKLSPHFRRLYNRLFGDDALNAALAVTISALEKGEGVAELAPVPGLASLLQVLAGILKKVQVRLGNPWDVQEYTESAVRLRRPIPKH